MPLVIFTCGGGCGKEPPGNKPLASPKGREEDRGLYLEGYWVIIGHYRAL
jgi:hypothetical protein